ncbi:MAG: hypothetical protein HOP08_03385 [Cyclobacteriaceae bacterium]|nr:hypothetical protein [Cyclobacteriaceae bacterium]
MKNTIPLNSLKQAKNKALIFGGIIVVYQITGVALIYNQRNLLIPFAVLGILLTGLILFLAKRMQWEISSQNPEVLDLYFRLGNLRLKHQSFKHTEIKDVLIEQDNQKYFILYLITDKRRIQIDRYPTRKIIDALRDHLAEKLQLS